MFVGDLIGRGPDQLDAVGLVRSMVEAGSALAVMGTHEFDALAPELEVTGRPGEYCRPHVRDDVDEDAVKSLLDQ